MTVESEQWNSFLDSWQEIKDKIATYDHWADEAMELVKPKQKAEELKKKLEDIRNG